MGSEESLLFQSIFPDWNVELRNWNLYNFDMGTRVLGANEVVKRTAFQSCYSVPPSSWDSAAQHYEEDFYDRLMLNMDLEKTVTKTTQIKGKLVTDLVDIEQLEVDFQEFEGNIMTLFD